MNCGFIKNYIETGNLIEEYFHNNGKKEGIYKIFDLKGNILVEAEYINDKKNGICKIYSPHNNLCCTEVYYIDDKLCLNDEDDKLLKTRYYYKDRQGYYIFKYLK